MTDASRTSNHTSLGATLYVIPAQGGNPARNMNHDHETAENAGDAEEE